MDIATEPKTLLTAADLPAVPNPDLPHELWRGVLRLVMPSTGAHGDAVSRLLVALGQHVYAQDLGTLFSESTGFVLERGPDTVLCPDIAFVAKQRLPAGGPGWTFPELAPDLAVEVLSPSDRPREVRAKVAQYLRLGVRCVWVFQPEQRRVQVHARGAGPGSQITTVVLGEGDVLEGGEVLPGFRYPLASLFGALRS
ncbi:MAG TPA: Uma2 family endonuclease [Thermoanaerobaculia bacterium]|jgi:Uma2 family endonuclease|nr:Uma2 family endonuclease [Thermoanaerobaculia bacterium]